MSNAIFKDLSTKTILITGATRGIGREIALSLAAQGAGLVFNFRQSKKEVADQLARELVEKGASSATALEFDINNTEQMKDAVNTHIKENGPIHGLVNNAGISKDTLLLRLKEEELTNILNTNLKSAIMLTSILSRNFLRVEEASIVNVSSIVGLMGNTSQVAYAASKAGLNGFTKSVAKELASKNIRCNAIAPGFIKTDMTDKLTDDAKNHYLNEIPLKRMGEPTEVANLVCFLLSVSSSYVTGEIIKIDGGLYI